MTRALVFDLDRTLFDRRTAFNRWVRSHSICKLQQQMIVAIDQDGCGDRTTFLEKVSHILDRQVTQTSFVKELLSFASINSDLIELLIHLRERYLLAVLSNGGSVSQRLKLTALGLDTVFEDSSVFISEEIGVSKPDLKAFQYVAKSLKLSPTKIRYFGDQINLDIKAARAAGWHATHVRSPRDVLRRLRTQLEVEA